MSVCLFVSLFFCLYVSMQCLVTSPSFPTFCNPALPELLSWHLPLSHHLFDHVQKFPYPFSTSFTFTTIRQFNQTLLPLSVPRKSYHQASLPVTDSVKLYFIILYSALMSLSNLNAIIINTTLLLPAAQLSFVQLSSPLFLGSTMISFTW